MRHLMEVWPYLTLKKSSELQNGSKEHYYHFDLQIHLLTLKVRSEVRCELIFEIFMFSFLHVDDPQHTCSNPSF